MFPKQGMCLSMEKFCGPIVVVVLQGDRLPRSENKMV